MGGGPAVYADQDIARDVFNTIVAGKSWAGEIEMNSKDGHSFPVSLRADAVKDENGEIIGLIGIHTDITERKRAEEKLKEQHNAIQIYAYELEAANEELRSAQEKLTKSNIELQESEKRFRDLADLLPLTVFETNMQGNLTYCNRIGFEMYNYTQSDTNQSMNITQVIAPEDVSRLQEHIDKVVRGEEPGNPEFTAMRKDGSTFPILTSASTIVHDNHVVGLRGFSVDITKRKRVEEALSNSEKTFRAVFENANDLIVLLDTDGTILKINGRTEYIFGNKAEDVVGRNFAELGFARTEDIEEIAQFFMQAVRGEKAPELIELEFTHGDGHTIPLEVNRSFITTDGETQQVLVVIRDISERKRAEQEASRARELEEVDQLRTALLASVSHELRTPLAAIKGMADSLRLPDVEWDSETQQDFLKSISMETETLTRIVEDLVLMSQLEAGITKMEKVPSTLPSVVVRLKEQLRRSSEMHSLQVDIPHNLPPIEVDEVHITQVISNLVSNAASYSDTGTRIAFTARVVSDEIVVSVSDQGIGIAPENIDKIFNRFYRLEPGVAHRRGGTGLGLSISRAIVESHGGRIWAESDGPGKGSTFYFTLPAAP
ncbi:MAG: PAS domain S-box protein [Chloroflexi bacterium]|nr:PAS domain S-box protein [Chloroflexota bacterium]